MIWIEFADRWSLKPDEEQQKFIRENWPGYSDDHKGEFQVPYSKVRVTWEEYRIWIERGFKMDIEPCKSMMLVKRTDRNGHDEEGPVNEFMSGKLFNVTLPDVGLLIIDEVDWLEDACTHELQSRLDKGWRILAVCPPNAQRRPDYILGRSKRNAE